MKKHILIIAMILLSFDAFAQMDWSKAFVAGKQRRADIFTYYDSKPGCIMFAGGSIMEDCEWKELFGNDKIINRGIDGETTEEFIARLPEMLRHKPSAVFIEIGSSDLNAKPAEEVLCDMEEIIKAFRHASKRTKVYILSVLPLPDGAGVRAVDMHGAPSVDNASVKKYNRDLEKLCKENKVRFVDVYDRFTDENGALNPLYGTSNVKLSVEGYRTLASCIEKYVR